MEKKYLKGNLNRNVAFGLVWVLSFFSVGPIGLGWASALLLLILDKDVLDLEDKRELVSVIACAVLGIVACLIPVINVCIIIAAIKAFMGGTFQIPGAYHIAKAIIKE